ncbi:MAG TPA: flagellar hook-length control protein FliK [Rhizobiaceae bacterium]|nr:flagellar hook-length control protein FliK [Rhizobiaceae bacterium]
MNAALPAILQQSSASHAARDRNSTAPKGDAEDFGKMLKAEGDARDGASAKTRDGSGTAPAEPASALELLPDDRLATDGEVAPAKAGAPKEGPEEADREEQDKPETAEALLSLIVAGPHDRASVQRGDAEPAQGTITNAAATATVKPAARPAEDATGGRKPLEVAVVERPDPVASNRPPEATFGKALIANLNDLATQAPDGPGMRAEAKHADGQGSEAAADARGARRDRGTLIADAVSRARNPREVGDRRSELRPAAEQKAQAAPVAQGPLATGAPVVEALAAKPAPSVPLHRVATADAHLGQSAPAIQSLKIQLQPVELGVVTANLRMTGEQLSVEIKVESVEAYNRLSGETEAIARALRSHGIAVDDVVIQAPQLHAVAPARDGGGGLADNSANAGRNFSTGAESGQSGGSGHPNRDTGRDNGYEIDKLSPVEQRTAGGGPRAGVYI